MLIISCMGIYIDLEVEKRQVTIERCLENPDFNGKVIEVTATLLNKNSEVYRANSSKKDFNLFSKIDLPLNEKIKILGTCRGKQGVDFIKFERFGGLRFLKVSISLLGFILCVYVFLRKFQIRLNRFSIFKLK